jgi:hypothetical protein
MERRKVSVDALPKSVTRGCWTGHEGGSHFYLDICTSLMHEGRGDVFVAKADTGSEAKILPAYGQR